MVTVAVFESEPRVAGPTVTGTTIGVEPPAAMFASVHVIVVVPLHPAGNAPAVTPAGYGSTTVTPCAVDGPALATVRV